MRLGKPAVLAACCGAAVLAGVAGWRVLGRDAAAPASQVSRGPFAGPDTESPPPARRAAPPFGAGTGEAPLPGSLRDTEPDGALTVDASGRFVPDASALALFDYFLSARGEEPDAAIRARIAAAIEARLGAGTPAARDAEALLARYLAYREAARALAGSPELAASADLERRLQWLRELRREHFGAALAATLFGDAERAAEIALARRRIVADATLSPAEREGRLEALEAELPDATRRARAEARAPLALLRDESALRAAGASDAEVRRLREERFGAEAADRLAALDRRRADWNARLATYREERAALAADPSLAPSERAAALDALRARHFRAEERIRVEALDAAAPTAD